MLHGRAWCYTIPHICQFTCQALILLHGVAGGQIEGDIRMNGHPKEQTSFARVSGYVEQNDVHSPQTTVREALNFSAQLRFAQGVPADTIKAFVDEVMGLVELTPLQHGLVRHLHAAPMSARVPSDLHNKGVNF